MSRKIKKIKRVYIEDEYTTVTQEDDDEMVGLKERLKKLKRVERDIFMVYVNNGTYASVAKKYNVSAPTAKSYINIIRDKLRKDDN